jgi:TolB-like protein
MAQTPDGEEVRAALETVLASQSFADATRQSDFLRFVVEETLAGRGDRLKGYTIGIEVFSKPDDFDAQSDPYVRVEAVRLRRRLAKYYQTEGADATVLIELKRGSYSPEFRYRIASTPPSESIELERAPRQAGSRRWRRAAAGIIGAVALITAITIIVSQQRNKPTTDGQSDASPARIWLDTLQNLGAPEFDYFAYGLSDELAVRLSGSSPAWNALRIYRGDDLKKLGVDPASIDYRLTGTVERLDTTVRVTARLVDRHSQRQLWTQSYTEALDVVTLLDIEERIATAVVRTLDEPVGPIADAELPRSLQRSPTTFEAYDCRLLYTYALETVSVAAQEAAKRCLEHFAEAGSLDASGWSILSMLYRWEYEFGVDFESDKTPAIDRAHAAAARALELDPNLPLSHHAMALVQLAEHDYTGAKESTEFVLSHDMPPTPRAVLGINLIRLGDDERGMQVLREAMTRAPRQLDYFYLGPTIYYTNKGEYGEALTWAERFEVPDVIWSDAFVAALAAQTGDMELAKRRLAHLLAAHPGFPAYARALIERWSFGPAAEATLIEGLRRAGLPDF